MLVDRHEDVTHPSLIDDDEECERSMTFYGYVRGTHLKPGMRVHLIGLGDYNMEDVTVLPDPCSLPDKEREQKVSSNQGCNHREKAIYSSMTHVASFFILV